MKILVINGPNLNLLGLREPGIYGKSTYEDLCNLLKEALEGIDYELYQSNHEGEIVDKTDVSGSANITNLADYVTTITRVEAEEDSIEEDCTIFSVKKNRPTGVQNKNIKLTIFNGIGKFL